MLFFSKSPEARKKMFSQLKIIFPQLSSILIRFFCANLLFWSIQCEQRGALEDKRRLFMKILSGSSYFPFRNENFSSWWKFNNSNSLEKSFRRFTVELSSFSILILFILSSPFFSLSLNNYQDFTRLCFSFSIGGKFYFYYIFHRQEAGGRMNVSSRRWWKEFESVHREQEATGNLEIWRRRLSNLNIKIELNKWKILQVESNRIRVPHWNSFTMNEISEAFFYLLFEIFFFAISFWILKTFVSLSAPLRLKDVKSKENWIFSFKLFNFFDCFNLLSCERDQNVLQSIQINFILRICSKVGQVDVDYEFSFQCNCGYADADLIQVLNFPIYAK